MDNIKKIAQFLDKNGYYSEPNFISLNIITPDVNIGELMQELREKHLEETENKQEIKNNKQLIQLSKEKNKKSQNEGFGFDKLLGPLQETISNSNIGKIANEIATDLEINENTSNMEDLFGQLL